MSENSPFATPGAQGGQPGEGPPAPISPVNPITPGAPGGPDIPGPSGGAMPPPPGQPGGPGEPPEGGDAEERPGSDRRRIVALLAIIGLVVVLLLAGWLFLTGAEKTPTASSKPTSPDAGPTEPGGGPDEPAAPDKPAPDEPGQSPPIAQPGPLPGIYPGARNPFEPLVTEPTEPPATGSTPAPVPTEPVPTQPPTEPGGSGTGSTTSPGGTTVAPALIQMTGQQSLQQGRFRVAMPPRAQFRWYVANPGETFAKKFTLARLRWDSGKQRICAVARYSGQTFRICRGDTVRF